MPGYRRANIDLANELFTSETTVKFIKIEEDRIGQLMQSLKNLRSAVKTFYEYDNLLIEETELFIRVCRKVVGSIRNYSTYFKANNESIVRYFSFTKKAIYDDLYKKNIEPIIELIKYLRKQDHNAYIDTLNKMQIRNDFTGDNTYLLTKQKIIDEYIEINGWKIKVMRDKGFVEAGIYADHVIFLGTSSYFDRKFSEVFYGKNTIFLGYSCFENRLIKRKSFSNLMSQNDSINTIYKNVTLEQGFGGIDYNETFLKDEKKSEKDIINQFKNATNHDLVGNVEVKLVTISNNNYIFLPLRQKVNIINRENLKITQEKVRDLSIGDLLVFRTQNASGLVREVADKIMGHNAGKYRENVEKWKKKIRLNVERKGIETVSRILTKRYEVKVAKENNIKNWISSYSIKPSCLNELLDAFNFELKEKQEIIRSTNEIVSAHISAGHQISQIIMNELDENLESLIDENGFYAFESKEFESESFNIEEIKKISKETYSILENETLKIIKR
ncbi:hypothetical protein [Metabacillus fastidiosus]|uniref:DISARM anti-phage system protein DrmE domain-containing protein n=1 Tax=Metabacillus fastidiosus TaxID=1458 RepID=UPI003D2C78B9